jgi:transcriptional regulator with XRE-family HTH domain
VEDVRIIVKLKRGPNPEIVDFMEGKEVKRLMRKNRVTIRELSQRMGITMKRIRQIRNGVGLEGRELMRDWVEGITGTDPGQLLRRTSGTC